MTILEVKINPFIESIESNIKEGNWYSALTLALTLPDICGRLSTPEVTSGKRYAKWFDEFVGSKYLMDDILGQRHIFASGNDFYALRCAFLHQGESDISIQRAKETVEKFKIQAPKVIDGQYSGSHNVKIDQYLMIRLDIFCEDIAEGVKKWVSENKGKTDVEKRANQLVMIDNNSISYNGVFIE
ncbi:hypothetical protein [Lysinibacillus sp. LZ02]|uniref:hypothetical protein n=1 Tax=Lysinibacillus sp. LZ02 TaxID=3420668 RepID=UPI003D36F7A3